MKPKNELLATLVAGVTLIVCGGAWGEGGDTLAPAASAIVTSVPAATYAASSSEALAYETLNAERSRCGFGLLAQNARLDQAATAHLNYSAQNVTTQLPSAVGHNPQLNATATRPQHT
ncbi:spore germination YkwD domain-containing protein [Verminephrobacter aporrectodeae]|uniref:hypothetical protein n=1 Tax=Verminephrobacter aporrectodeae TaxID=1110389 RepID=UPI0038B374CC